MSLGALALGMLSAWQRGFGPPGTFLRTISVAGVQRRFLLHVPPTRFSGRPMPLLILLHGWMGAALDIEEVTGFDRKSDEEGFLLAVPEGLGRPQGWNAGFFDLTGAHHPDDLGFISHLIDRLSGDGSIDPARIYIAGHSNGAMMAEYLAARLGDRVAAVADVAGTIGVGGRRGIPDPVAPVSVIIIHGRRDGMVAYEPSAPALLKGISSPAAARWWASMDGCRTDPVESTFGGGNVVVDRYPGGRHGTEVELISIRNGVHDWPGGVTANGIERATGVNATDLIWDFFRSHPKQ